MRDLLIQLLQLSELRLPEIRHRVIRLAKSRPSIKYLGPEKPRSSAVGIDTGITNIRFLDTSVTVISMAVVGRNIGAKLSYIIRLNSDEKSSVKYARELELREAEKYSEVLIDGPILAMGLNPPKTSFLAISKDVKFGEYCKRRSDRVGEWMCEVAKYVGERLAASILLSDAASGQYLEPVNVGNNYVTYVRIGPYAAYVEFNDWDLIGELSKGYPIQLKLSHRLARTGSIFMKNMSSIVSRLMRDVALPSFRRLIL